MAKGDTVKPASKLGFCLSIITILFVPTALSEQYDRATLTLALRKPTGEIYKGSPHIVIVNKKAVKEIGESLAVLLRRNGIQFTGSAASVFYGLNPGMSDFEYVPAGSEVNVPYAYGDAETENAVAQGFLVHISVDSPLKGEIVADVEQLLNIKLSVVTLNAGAFRSSQQKDDFTRTFLQATDYLLDIKTLVQEDTQPFSAEALRQYQGDAEVLLFVAKKALQTTRVSDAEFNASSLVEKDLATKARGINGSKSPGNVGRDPQATMLVTLLQKNNSRVGTIRLCYAVEALFAKRKYCSTTLGPHVKWILPVADYLVWAAIDESSPPLTKPRPVALETVGEEVPVELVLQD
jgi:hypothetical protein